jgi:hypothetical protein
MGCTDQERQDTGSRVPLRLFVTEAAATEFVAKLAAQARATMNPFHLQGVSELAQEQIESIRFDQPPPTDRWYEVWREWWDSCVDSITDETRLAVWAVFGLTAPYEITAIEIPDEK